MAITEAQLVEKQAILMQHMPLSKGLLKHLDDWYKTELTYSSCELEGNALSRADTALAISKEIASGGKKISDHLEIIANAKAWETIRDLALRNTIDQISVVDIINLYQTLSPQGIDDTKILSMLQQTITKSAGSAIQKAIDVHCNILISHIFPNQNGQMARLLLNLFLMQAGYTPAIIDPRTKDRYDIALQNYQTNPDEMRQIIYLAIAKSLDAFIQTAESGISAISHASKRPIKIIKKEGPLKIGELAAAVGETVPTIRFWTKEGLLSVNHYTNGGYQLYDYAAIEKAEQIRRLQNEQRLSIKELKEKLAS